MTQYTITTITPADLRDASTRFVEIYREIRDGSNNPNDTIRASVAALGYDTTAAMLATWVNIKAEDDRISRRNKDHAATVPGALAGEDARNNFVFFPEETIHACHLDQLANAMRNYTPEPEPTDTDETPEAQTEPEAAAETPAAAEVPNESAPQEFATATASPINEELARRAMEMNSYRDYIPGSATAEYERYCAAADEIAARQKAKTDPMHHGKIDALLASYKKRIAEYINRSNEIDTRCPSWLVTGGSNFPTGKKAKQNAARDKNMEFYNDTQALLDKIRSVGMGGISADDPDAAAKIEQKLTARRELQERMKAANAAIRMKDTAAGDARLAELGFTPKEINDLRAPDFLGRVGFANYELSNNNAEIHRLEKRLADLRKRAENQLPDFDFDGGHAEANADENRLQLFFNGKPSDEIRDALKKEGYRWSPRFGAWQRQLTPNAYRAIKYAFGNLGIAIHETADGDAAEDVTEVTPTEPETDAADLTPEQAETEQATEPAPQEEITTDPPEGPETTAPTESAQSETEPAPQENAAPVPTVKIYWNGIKYNGGKLIKCRYSSDPAADSSVTVYADDYTDLPRDLLPVVNESDGMTDYYETDRATVTKDHPLYRFFRHAYQKATERMERRHLERLRAALAEIESGPHRDFDCDFTRGEIERAEKTLAAVENAPDPGQPTAEDIAAVYRLNLEAENARREAEQAEALRQREETLRQRAEGAAMIRAEMELHPIRENEPTVTILWSESPAFYNFRDNSGDCNLPLSVAAADAILRRLDALLGVQGYDKTKFCITGTDPDGEEIDHTGRYDIGDNDGGLVAHIRNLADWYRTHDEHTGQLIDDPEPETENTRFAAWLATFLDDPTPSDPTPTDPQPEEAEPANVISFPVSAEETVTEPEPLPESVTIPDAAPFAEILAAAALIPGCTAEVKGAKTARPIIWLHGVTKEHKDAAKAIGAIWSPKKSAWWITPDRYAAKVEIPAD